MGLSAAPKANVKLLASRSLEAILNGILRVQSS
jgi:hypothetical protein